jgi:predicted O-methyltransferase YrrM
MRKKSREILIELFNKYETGAEIGVHKGSFSFAILKASNIKTLYSIDPWIDEKGNFVKEVYNECANRLRAYGNRSKIIIKKSIDAAKDFADDSLDFVYIDGDHSYEACLADLNVWTPKVKIGGIVSGHDYKNGGKAMCSGYGSETIRCRVKFAVRGFIRKNNYNLNILLGQGNNWYFIKDH